MSPVERYIRASGSDRLLRRRGLPLLALAGLLLAVGAMAWGLPAGSRAQAVAPATRAATAILPAAVGAADSSTANAATGYVGFASCTLSACHGRAVAQNRDGHPRLNELGVWLNDPHSRAYSVLFEQKSLDILSRLGVIKNGQLSPDCSDRQWQNCLKCHSPAAVDAPDSRARHEGVGCEACHGAGEVWGHTHWRDAGEFRKLPADHQDRRGFRDTKDLFVRAELCVKCHVGQKDGDVNHDLIAAGHPMLAFELSSYQRLMPAHWDEAREQKSWGDAEDHQLRLWLGGQMASTMAALQQLERRVSETLPGDDAERADDCGPVWPELSELECFACHHGLADDGRWRAAHGFATTDVGQIVAPSRNWNFGLIKNVLTVKASADHESVREIDELQQMMQAGLFPDPVAVQTAARSAIISLKTPFDELKSDSLAEDGQALRRVHHDLLQALVQDENAANVKLDAHAVRSWEHAAQLYLALAADAARRREQRDELESLRVLLSEDDVPGLNSPARFRGEIDAEPDQSQRERIRQLLLSIIQQPPSIRPPGP